MTGQLIRVSPRALGMFLDCPRSYRHEYLDRPTPTRWGGPWAHLTVGNAVHLALAEWWDLPDQERRHEAGARLVAKHWPATAAAGGFRDEQQRLDALARAQSWVRRYLINTDPYARPAGIERTVSTVEAGMTLTGRIDRVDRRGSRLVVVDYKTGREPTDWDTASSYALAVYVLAAGRTFRGRCARAELHHLPTGEVTAVDYDRDRLFRQIDRIGEIAGDMATRADTLTAAPDAADELYPTNPGPLCATCPFREHCPTGQAAIPPAEPWQYLATDESESAA